MRCISLAVHRDGDRDPTMSHDAQLVWSLRGHLRTEVDLLDLITPAYFIEILVETVPTLNRLASTRTFFPIQPSLTLFLLDYAPALQPFFLF